MQLAFNHNIDQYCYYKNRPIYASLDKANKDSKIKMPQSKVQEVKPSNNFYKTIEISNKALKEKKKYQGQKRNKKDSNSDIPAFKVNITNKFNDKKHIQ